MVRIVAPNALVVAEPNFSASSQNTTKIPRDALENGTKPTFTASGIGKSSKIRAVADSRSELRRGELLSPIPARFRHQGFSRRTMACLARCCQASTWLAGHILRIINHIARVPRPSHFVDRSKGW